ncbi:putative O-methyltransferase YrrM [Saccharomonospora amisosensis]|uniref:Putative O-methyltransferase YrrM n=1 Tax=Saccharomonospora amisosensis TaxID=1128677 RepID=A0A7X5ZSA8_9PSEU|nr:O-methyltransferase [Saccharomonospora amisosensis]NIJ13150.1 putative O-methyltransferase YrrM [Saccharomonospora amisosensis]
MTAGQWTAVDDYFNTHLLGADPALDAAAEASAEAGLPAIAVAPSQGKLLYLLARTSRARSILEIGTLGGYSTIWLGRALPSDGKLITLEVDEHHAEVARENIDRAGLAARVDIRVGKALDTLPSVREDSPFDLVFIDADKPNIAEYFRWAVELSRPGTVIVVDNVVRGGEVADAGSEDPAVRGVRHLIELLSTEPRVEATALQTVGAKGYDGLAIALVTG